MTCPKNVPNLHSIVPPPIPSKRTCAKKISIGRKPGDRFETNTEKLTSCWTWQKRNLSEFISPTRRMDQGSRRKSTLAAVADRLILQYLAGPERTTSFYKYCDKYSQYLGKKNSRERKSSENKKHELRKKLVHAPESFMDQLLHFGLNELAKDTEENLESLVRFHLQSKARNRKIKRSTTMNSDDSPSHS